MSGAAPVSNGSQLAVLLVSRALALLDEETIRATLPPSVPIQVREDAIRRILALRERIPNLI